MTIFNWTYQQQEAFYKCPFVNRFEYRMCCVEYALVHQGYKIQIYLFHKKLIAPTFISEAICTDIETYCKMLIDTESSLNTPGKYLLAKFLEKPWLPRWMAEWVQPSKDGLDAAIHLLLLASTDRLHCSKAEDKILFENPDLIQRNKLLVCSRSLMHVLSEWHHLVTQVVTYKSSYTVLTADELQAMQRLLKRCFGISKAPLSTAVFR